MPPVRDRLPSAEDEVLVGGLPSVVCPPVTPVPYTFDVGLAILDAADGDNPAPGSDVLLVGVLGGEAAIVPAGTFSGHLESALPLTAIAGAPTAEDLPGSWQTLAPETPGMVGAVVPLAAAQSVMGENGLWLRLVVTDQQGCVTYGAAFLPAVPEVALDGTAEAYVTIDSGVTFEHLTVTDDGLAQVDSFAVVDHIGACPAPRRAVAVGQVCGSFTVEGAAAGEADVSDSVDATADAGTPTAGGTLDAGAVSIVVSAFGDPAGLAVDSTATIEIGAADIRIPINGPVVVLGQLGLGIVYPSVACNVAIGAGAGEVTIRAVGLYPPA